MSKKHFGKFLTATVIAGAAIAGCVAYFTKYKDFRKSLDEDFNDFEDEASENDKTEKPEQPVSIKREYVSIPLDTPEDAPETSDLSENTEPEQ